MDGLGDLSTLLVVLILAAAAVWSVHRSVSAEDRIREEVSALRATAAAEIKTLADHVAETLERITRERARMDGERGGRRRAANAAAAATEPPPPDPPSPDGARWTHASYLAYVERTGRSDPAIERQLGLL